MTSLKEKFIKKVDLVPGGCWSWLGAHNRTGYGTINIKHASGRWTVVGAHRLAWELFNGPIPEGMQVLHNCDNPNCVNPEHLRLGTQSENIKESFDKGRSIQKGEYNGAHVLTEEAVREIRTSDSSNTELGEKYGVHSSTISLVRSNKRWGHVS
jgi:hypothetical protein